MEAPPQSPPQSTPGSAVGTPLSVASSGWRSVEDAAARASAALTPELQHAPLEAPRTGPRGSPVRATHSNALFDDPDSSPAFGVKFGTEVSARPGAARGALFAGRVVVLAPLNTRPRTRTRNSPPLTRSMRPE